MVSYFIAIARHSSDVVFKSSNTFLEQLTSWITMLLEKLMIAQPVKKFPAFYGTRKFIIVFKIACH
jgi:hypothetical protein